MRAISRLFDMDFVSTKDQINDVLQALLANGSLAVEAIVMVIENTPVRVLKERLDT